MADPRSLLGIAYGDLSAVLCSLTVEEGWEPTGCAGWTPVDLGFHLLSDARRALVALHTPPSAHPTPPPSTTGRRGVHRRPATRRSSGRRGSPPACTAG
jgi:hypothetical protein